MGKDFFTWILEGGDIQKLVVYAGSLGPCRIAAQLLEEKYPGSDAASIPTLSNAGDICQKITVTTLNNVKEIRRVLEAIPQGQLWPYIWGMT